jgi:hypothetical protein
VGVSSTRPSEPPDTIASPDRISTNISTESTIASHMGGRPGEGLWLGSSNLGSDLFCGAYVGWSCAVVCSLVQPLSDTFFGHIKRKTNAVHATSIKMEEKKIAIRCRHSTGNNVTSPCNEPDNLRIVSMLTKRAG